MRISGWQVPPGYLRWAAAGLALLLLSVAIATVVSVLGLFGFTAAAEDAGTRVPAKVATGSPCDRPNAFEIVTFRYDGEGRQARFDGCGHAKGELVDILVPPGPVVDSMVVQSAGAAVGNSVPGEGLALVLLVASGLAGAVFAFQGDGGSRVKRSPTKRAQRWERRDLLRRESEPVKSAAGPDPTTLVANPPPRAHSRPLEAADPL